ncbi:MAG: PEP-CTERM sorting domain-containing protein [Terriglobia bacterium]
MDKKKLSRFRAVTVLGVLALLLGAAPAWAETFMYSAHNHPDGNAAPPFYGLRLDFNGTKQTFDFTNVLFTIDPGAGTASIAGTITHNQAGSGTDATYTIMASFSAMSIRDLGSTGWFDGGDPIADLLAAGIDPNNAILFQLDSMVLSDGNSYGGVLEWFGKSKANGDEFLLVVGHRLDGQPNPEVVAGFGWLQTANGQTGTNDFLFTMDLQPVPEPGTVFLVGGGLTALGLLRRRRARFD